ncbi:hypothetical protein E4U57_007853 [Claviceps arundinis]|uniref:Uncharacterized protein n=1 Tax=Claviceps arundinis TaxID=1623583 RepID=A0A9P7SST7_9HYPO|nr:hypothetical protein E4U57_007853 [Claviceps arundinis]KAG5974628.1 hypothetical protein E4U56_004438 [Claviceps arundinis]
MAADHLDRLDASLQDFETPASPRSMRQSHSHSPSPSPAVLLLPPSPPPAMEDLEAEEVDSDIGSVGGFSPPAWRRLGNGDRSSGFWKHPHPLQEDLGEEEKQFARQHWAALRGAEDSDSDRGREVLEEAIRTRLPLGSLSPMKQLSPSPRKQLSSSPGKQQSLSPRQGEAKTIAVRGRANSMTSPVKRLGSGAPQWMEPREGRISLDPEPRASLGLETRASPELDFRGSPGSDNYFRFAVRAEVQQRTQPIEAALLFVQQSYHSIIKNWRSILTTLLAAFVSISIMRVLVKPAAPLPVGDLIKVAGIARAFEPLIYFSEPAVAHVHHLQATSIAVWDLAESVRVSGMADAEVIVQSLDAVSETMKRLVLDYTRFHTHVDGDIDGIITVMDWAKTHLQRLNSSPPPSSISHVYDNIHNFLTSTAILENATGQPTCLGRLATAIFGLSNPQREQRQIQIIFNNFLTTLEEAIQTELHNSISLFALFDDIDANFLRLARTVAHETSTQDEFEAELLSNLWTRMLGSHAKKLRKFKKNQALLHDVRAKTVRNKGNLVGHHGKLLTLKSSLESLRGKLASQLLRGQNSSTLTLEDQIRGIVEVRDYLWEVRAQQKSKVMEALYTVDRGYNQLPAEIDGRVLDSPGDG